MGIRNSFFEWMFSWCMKKDESRTLCIMGSNSMKHPSGDIDFVKAEQNKVLLALNEMSLCGTDSPLEDYLVADIRTEQESSSNLATLLNTLQHNLAMLRFNAILERSSFLMRKLGNEKWQNRFATYNEKFSPELLRCFFAKMFPNCKVRVHCFEPCRIENPAPALLGRANLNAATLLGSFCTSLTSAMSVILCNVPLQQSIELKRKKDFLNVKFPFKVRLNFTTEICDYGDCRLGVNKLSEDFWLGNKNFENFKWEKWL